MWIRGCVALLCWLLASPTWAAITEVASQRATTGVCDAVNDCSLAFPNNVTAGSLLVVGGASGDTTLPTHVITDTIGTTYTIKSCTAIDDGSNFTQAYIAYGVAPSAGANTVLVDPTGTGVLTRIDFAIDEFSGVHATPLDVDISNSTGTGTAVTDALTTLTANDLVLGLDGLHASATNTPGGDYTQIGESQAAAAGFNFVFRLVTTATSYTVDWTLGTSQEWVACTLAIKEAVAASILQSPPLPMILFQ